MAKKGQEPSDSEDHHGRGQGAEGEGGRHQKVHVKAGQGLQEGEIRIKKDPRKSDSDGGGSNRSEIRSDSSESDWD